MKKLLLALIVSANFYAPTSSAFGVYFDGNALDSSANVFTTFVSLDMTAEDYKTEVAIVANQDLLRLEASQDQEIELSPVVSAVLKRQNVDLDDSQKVKEALKELIENGEEK